MSDAFSQRRDDDVAIGEVAGRQKGVVTRRQLLEAGVPGHVVDHRLRRGRLLRVHRGVYRVGPAAISVPGALETAALLACGDEAVLCRRSAGTWWRLLPERGRGAPVEVGLRRGCRRAHRGIRVLRLEPLPSDEISLHRGLFVTTPARTLLDLARILPDGALERVLATADRRGLAAEEDVRSLLERHRGRRATRRLRMLLERPGGPAFTRSEAEARLLDLIRRAKLPIPQTNVVVAGVEVDFFWPERRLVAEMDGYAHHASRSSFEWDRERDAELLAAGLKVHRVTWRKLESEPEAVLARLAPVLVSGHGGSGR